MFRRHCLTFPIFGTAISLIDASVFDIILMPAPTKLLEPIGANIVVLMKGHLAGLRKANESRQH